MASGEQAPEKPPATLPIPVERLQKAINDTLGTSGRILSTDCEIIAEGKGFLSFITKTKITWAEPKEEKLPTSVIVKKPTLERIKDLPVISEILGNRDDLMLLHNRECDAYAVFTAQKQPPFAMAPLFLAEKMTEELDSGLLVLEDLSEVGRSLHFNDDATLDQIMAIAGHVASLQAYGFNHPEYKEKIGTMPTKFFDHLLKLDALADAAVMRKTYPDLFTITDEQIIDIEKEVKDFMDVMMDAGSHGYTTVLCLGDVQPNNILWKINPDESLSSEVAAFLDFQVSCQGHCTLDIGSVMTMNLPVDVRQLNEEKILNHYLNTLKSKCNIDPGITMTEVRQLLADQMKFAAFASLGMSKSIAEFGPRLGLTKEREIQIVERLLAGFGTSRATITS